MGNTTATRGSPSGASALAAVLQVMDHGSVRVLRLARPPVNALGWSLRMALWQALECAEADASVQAVVLAGAGGGFSAGGDFKEMGLPEQHAMPGLGIDLLPRIETLRKPVVAALHGYAVGGGFELALACPLRVSHPDTLLALPEVKHGLIAPTGTQRLPRAVGVAYALKMMLEPATHHAGDLDAAAHSAGLPFLFDRCAPGDPVALAIELLQSGTVDLHCSASWSARLLRHRAVPTQGGDAALTAARAALNDGPGNAARLACIDAVEAALRAQDFDGGLSFAWQAYAALTKQLRPASAVPSPEGTGLGSEQPAIKGDRP
jgi:3-hydroxyacyl-CoA dehydrogenase